MQLHLILPGLLWPNQILRDTLYDLDLPGLAWLVGRARSTWQAPQTLETCLCRSMGIDTQPPPLAALRLLGEQQTIDKTAIPVPQDAIWMCADPVSLRIDRNRIALVTQNLDITSAEMQQITSALQPLFANFGTFHAGQPGHGYLQLTVQPRFDSRPPNAVFDESHLLPQGEDAAIWRRLGNEIQILLHNLPLNTQREQQGKPLLNSIWFWGPGCLPSTRQSTYTQLIGQQALLPGLARWSNLPHTATLTQEATTDSLPKLLQTEANAHAPLLLLLDDLLAPTQQRDAMRWRAALQRIDRDWLQPLQSALAAGRLKSLRLTALGEQASLDLYLQRSDLLKIWRRPCAFHEFTNAVAQRSVTGI